MRIRIKLFIGFMSIALLIFVFALVAILAGQQALTETAERSMLLYNENLMKTIDRTIENRIEEFRSYTTDLIVQDTIAASNHDFENLTDIPAYLDARDREWRTTPADTLSPTMQELLNNQLAEEIREKIEFYEKKNGYPVYGEVFITNKYGANIAQTNRTSDYRQDDEIWWQEARDLGSFVEDISYDESSKLNSIVSAYRIEDENGDFMGVLKATINIQDSIRVLREEAASPLGHIHLALLDGSQRVIYSSHGIAQFEPFPLRHFITDIRGSFRPDPHNSDLIATYVRSRGYQEYDGLNWTLIAESTTEDTLAPITTMRLAFFFFSLSAIAAAFFVGIILSSAILSPLQRLRAATSRIAEGFLDERIAVPKGRRDEFADLAQSFNAMTENLQKSRVQIESHARELEEKVSERTADLDLKVTELMDTKQALINMMEDSDEANKLLIDAQKSLEETIKKLKNLDAKKDEFISIAAHELKTPLTSIHGFSQLLLNPKIAHDNEKREKFLKIIDTETKRLAHLVTDILDLSRIDLGTFKLNASNVNLMELLEDIKKEMNIQISAQKLTATYEIEENLPTIVTDRERLIEILMNLINNAVKYTPKGSITIRVFRENDMIHVVVKDNGIGIAAENHPNIFKRFYQVDSSYTRAAGGTGLGLALSKEFITAMGGNIWFTSEVGKGSEFHFTIPRTLPPEQMLADAHSVSAPIKTTSSMPLQHKKRARSAGTKRRSP